MCSFCVVYFTCAPRSLTSSTDQRPSYWIQTKIPPSVSQVASFWKGSFHRTKTTLKTQEKDWWKKTMVGQAVLCPYNDSCLWPTLTVFSGKISIFKWYVNESFQDCAVLFSMAVKECSSDLLLTQLCPLTTTDDQKHGVFSECPWWKLSAPACTFTSAEMPKMRNAKSKFPHFKELNLALNQMKIYHKVG